MDKCPHCGGDLSMLPSEDKCLYCDDPFKKKRPWQKFCSPACQSKWFYARKLKRAQDEKAGNEGLAD